VSRRKWLLSVVGAILVGAVGSGVWDLFMRRAVFAVLELFYLVATFGVSSFRDRAYSDAALGYREYSSLALLACVPVIALAIGGTPLLFGLIVRRLGIRPVEGESDEQKELRVRRLRRTGRIAHFTSVALAFAMLLQIGRFIYTNAIISHFQNCLARCAPVLSVDEEEQYLAQFAMVQTRQDYVVLLSSLQRVATSHNIRLRDLDLWDWTQ